MCYVNSVQLEEIKTHLGCGTGEQTGIGVPGVNLGLNEEEGDDQVGGRDTTSAWYRKVKLTTCTNVNYPILEARNGTHKDR